MEYYVGIDVSLKESSVCVVDGKGKIIREAKAASEPEALRGLISGIGFPVTRIGMEAGPLSQWLRQGLVDAGLEVVLLETRHVKAALSAMTVKTDRKDARGIAQLLRVQRWISPDSCRSRLKDQAAVFRSGFSSFLLFLLMPSRNVFAGVLPFMPRPWCGRLVL